MSSAANSPLWIPFSLARGEWLRSSLQTLVFCRDCRATGVGGARLCVAVTIEPFEVCRWVRLDLTALARGNGYLRW